ncbi:homeobox-leucine zipper protein REVOLUTA-like isoform X2 [Sesamum indicum]|uniref:Homeobox-leucine zipper protein REVOLUTA-like isoform X2 n=1 Tax=Sesamum indicum TaxID=4182 RepID=A0A6I9TGA7_SESIN|nr:homeobox-leucine zipper protein REVOLUTA-like isoform X2 [Sesamum indicum]
MARTELAIGEGSQGGRGGRRGRPEGGRRAQIMREQPILRGINNKQLKVWFQNRRCREKQKKENGNLALENRRLATANKMLRQENDGLQKKLAQVLCENDHLRNQVITLTSTITTYNLGRQPEANDPQLPIRIGDNNSLLSLAEETKKEFLSKAIGTAVNWIPVPGLKLRNPESTGTIYVSATCIGVAARACVTIPGEPIKIIEILKNRLSWSRSCRNMDVVAKYPVENGGTIELIYTQYYAPTIMACARDFWTLRYTSILDDGSFVVCEQSISGSDGAPSSPVALEFVRGRMLVSGYLIRPCEGGSTIDLLDHLDLEASSVPEVVRPLYESSELMAKQMIVSALHFIEHVGNETNGKQIHSCHEDPAFLRSVSRRLCRGFNDAVNCFSEDGWTLMNVNASDDIIMSIKRTASFGVGANYDSIICVKASLLLQNVIPASLVRLLKEHRSAWMDFNFADHSVAFSKAACYAYPGPTIHNLSGTPVMLGHTNHDDEELEVIRFERSANQQHVSSGDLYHLQVITGMDDTGFGACSELIFAPIDRTIPNDAALLCSGFRIFLLGSNTGEDTGSSNIAPNEALNARNAQAAISHPLSMLIVAFQFPSEADLQEDVASMARQYVKSVISSVKNISLRTMSSGSNPVMHSHEANPAMGLKIPESTYFVNLADLICQSYRSSLGVDMVGFNCESTDSMLEQIHHHHYAILCFSFMSLQACLYANQAALNMLETTLDNLHMLTVERILDGSNNLSLFSVFPTIMQQGYAILPPGNCLSVTNRCVSYAQAVVWKVLAPDGSVHCLALALIDWSFV